MSRPRSRFAPRPLDELVALTRARSTRQGSCLIYGRARSKAGYGQVWDGFRNHYTHRVMCEAVHGAPPSPHHEAIHSCDTPACVEPAHLSWGTHAQNIADMHRRGRARKRGQRLDLDVVRAIRRRAADGEPQHSLAAAVDRSIGSVNRIVRRKAWKDV